METRLMSCGGSVEIARLDKEFWIPLNHYELGLNIEHSNPEEEVLEALKTRGLIDADKKATDLHKFLEDNGLELGWTDDQKVVAVLEPLGPPYPFPSILEDVGDLIDTGILYFTTGTLELCRYIIEDGELRRECLVEPSDGVRADKLNEMVWEEF